MGSPQKRKSKSNTRPEAIVTKPAPRKTFAQVFVEMRGNVSPTDTGVNVKTLRKTRSCDILVEVRLGTTTKDNFGKAIGSTL